MRFCLGIFGLWLWGSFFVGPCGGSRFIVGKKLGVLWSGLDLREFWVVC